MSVWVRVVCGVAGLALELVVLDAAIRTFLLPRVANVTFSRLTARGVGVIFNWLARSSKEYLTRDRILSMFPPVVLLTYQASWLALSLVAFALLFVAGGVATFAHAFSLSGSSIFTLGVTAAHGGTTLTAGVPRSGRRTDAARASHRLHSHSVSSVSTP